MCRDPSVMCYGPRTLQLWAVSVAQWESACLVATGPGFHPQYSSQTGTDSQKSLQRRLRVLSAEFSSLSICVCKLPIRWPLVNPQGQACLRPSCPSGQSSLADLLGSTAQVIASPSLHVDTSLTLLLGGHSGAGVTICARVLEPPR